MSLGDKTRREHPPADKNETQAGADCGKLLASRPTPELGFPMFCIW